MARPRTKIRRQDRDVFIQKMAKEIQTQTGSDKIHAFRTENVVFLLAAQPNHLEHFDRVKEKIKVWADGERWIGLVPANL